MPGSSYLENCILPKNWESFVIDGTLADNVLAGTTSVDEAYKTARERKTAAARAPRVRRPEALEARAVRTDFMVTTPSAETEGTGTRAVAELQRHAGGYPRGIQPQVKRQK